MKVTKRNGHNVAWFYDQTYMANVYVLWPVEEPEVKVFIKKQWNLDYQTDRGFYGRALQILDEKNVPRGYVIALNEFKLHPACISALSHECFHLTSYIMEACGVVFSHASEEAYTYLHESLMRRTLELLWPKSTKRKKIVKSNAGVAEEPAQSRRNRI